MLDNGEMPPEDAPSSRRPSNGTTARMGRALPHGRGPGAAGDPGPVVLRRLSNAEYTYTLRDLTGVDVARPGREFPVDGAAGEGFTNTGNALVMSPALLTKYLDAAKEVAATRCCCPTGSVSRPARPAATGPTRPLAKIREFYREFTDSRGGDKVNLQGIVFDTNDGGRLPLENTSPRRSPSARP